LFLLAKTREAGISLCFQRVRDEALIAPKTEIYVPAIVKIRTHPNQPQNNQSGEFVGRLGQIIKSKNASARINKP
jgi:hypothetical protein